MVIGVCCGGNLRTHCWTPVMREDIKLRKAFQAKLAHGWANPGVGGVQGGHGERSLVGDSGRKSRA